ncbi:MAG: glycosyl transferase group 1 [Chitinophagaceae bacterium]|nr:glycosyl transferase group 1 [Chitinophagaceae bacterium]
MKVLLVNWSWYPSGGDWTYVDNVKQLYENNGYQVIPFSRINERNFETPFKKYYVKTEDIKVLNQNKSLVNGFKAVKDSIVSADALKKLDQILKDHPDIAFAHLHNIHHYITPAIIWKLKKNNIKVIWTLHDYKIICPENSFVSNGVVCEKCITGNFFNCAINKCKKQSLPASFLASVEAYFYHKSNIYNKVDAYLCPSEFLFNKFKQFGFSTNVLKLTNYCYDIGYIDEFINSYQVNTANPKQDYVLYVGRMENIKGVKTLLDAIKGQKIHLKLAGAGTATDDFINYAQSNGIDNVTFLGFQDKQSIFELTYNAKFVVCPSEWYENYPFSIIESLLFSKPVIGANIGGIPELVRDNETGYLYEAGNSAQLREKMLALWNNEDDIQRMGNAARKYIYDIVNFKNHWNKLEKIIKAI